MAIDFEKLNNRTPEEKEADRKEIWEKLEARILLRIAEHRGKIERLVPHLDAMPEKSAQFVNDLHYQSTTFDMDNRMGGRLYELTDKQITWLDNLCKQYVGPQENLNKDSGSSLDVKVDNDADVQSGSYHGLIAKVVDGYVLQKIGRDPAQVVRHEMSRLSGVIAEGDVVDIKYEDGRGAVGVRGAGVER